MPGPSRSATQPSTCGSAAHSDSVKRALRGPWLGMHAAKTVPRVLAIQAGACWQFRLGKGGGGQTHASLTWHCTVLPRSVAQRSGCCPSRPDDSDSSCCGCMAAVRQTARPQQASRGEVGNPAQGAAAVRKPPQRFFLL